MSRGRKDMNIQRRSKRQNAFVIDTLYIMRGGEDKRVAIGEIAGEIETWIEELLAASGIGNDAKGGERAEKPVEAIAVVEMAMGEEDTRNGTVEREDGADVATIDKPTGVRSAGGDKGIGAGVKQRVDDAMDANHWRIEKRQAVKHRLPKKKKGIT